MQVLAVATNAMARIFDTFHDIENAFERNFYVAGDDEEEEEGDDDMTPNDALTAYLRWIIVALNSARWSPAEMIHGTGVWYQVREICKDLASRSSRFQRKAHAAKVYALLSSPVLLDAHLELT